MATSRTKRFRAAPLQRLTVRPIEDPAEQAALDERLKHSNIIVADVSTPPGESSEVAANGPQTPRSKSSRPLTRKRKRGNR